MTPSAVSRGCADLASGLYPHCERRPEFWLSDKVEQSDLLTMGMGLWIG
ncbi:hypothetical protein AM1_F0031 (plasmid) [Acaryochloris marina MBIC11017]|uniref:Uncharacterized protein n=1 Tax=Acaryochloris marina (strain MBIC 11017) TaxID=329726 RepID=A8ZQ14_ACAM1|nr:hypothetical protein AM1_F0031 [Acaryochloris marina MBIC11017]